MFSLLSLRPLTAPFAGALIKYVGTGPVILSGAVLTTLGIFLSSIGREFYVLVILIPFVAGKFLLFGILGVRTCPKMASLGTRRKESNRFDFVPRISCL